MKRAKDVGNSTVPQVPGASNRLEAPLYLFNSVLQVLLNRLLRGSVTMGRGSPNLYLEVYI